jgi:hypothetical protein
VYDLYFWVDIYLRLRHFAELRDGFLVTDENEFRLMYMYGQLRFDVVCSLPLNYLVLAAGQVDMRKVATLRLCQCFRVVRFTLYLDYFMNALSEYANIRVSTAMLRIFQMFILVILLCHWFGSFYFYLALKDGVINTDPEEKSWVWMDDKDNSTDVEILYLRGFYWALYTVTTIGYGSVPCNKVTERLFAMFVMAVGAIICDAGITAVLSSYISNKDYQAGTNNRRIKCCKQFMKSGFVDNEFQQKVLDFYSYADSELNNLDESEILGDVSVAVAQQILNHFCYDSLRKSSYLAEYTDGGVVSLVNSMKPHIAVPGERIIEIGAECVQVYVACARETQRERARKREREREREREDGFLSCSPLFTLTQPPLPNPLGTCFREAESSPLTPPASTPRSSLRARSSGTARRRPTSRRTARSMWASR